MPGAIRAALFHAVAPQADGCNPPPGGGGSDGKFREGALKWRMVHAGIDMPTRSYARPKNFRQKTLDSPEQVCQSEAALIPNFIFGGGSAGWRGPFFFIGTYPSPSGRAPVRAATRRVAHWPKTTVFGKLMQAFFQKTRLKTRNSAGGCSGAPPARRRLHAI